MKRFLICCHMTGTGWKSGFSIDLIIFHVDLVGEMFAKLLKIFGSVIGFNGCGGYQHDTVFQISRDMILEVIFCGDHEASARIAVRHIAATVITHIGPVRIIRIQQVPDIKP